MAVDTFVPELWSAILLKGLEASHVATNLVNRDYEGEIRNAGDTVHINSFSPVTIKGYTKNSDIEEAERLTTTDQTLVINQSKYFNFGLDDVDKAQALGGLMERAMRSAAYGLADAADKFLFKTMAAGAETTIGTSSTAAVQLTAANIYEEIVKVGVALDKKNVPSEGRWIVLPPEAKGLLLLEDRFVSTGGAKAEEVIRKGYIGEVAGFEVFISNNLSSGAGQEVNILAGTREATTYAEQIIKTEAYRKEKGFEDGVKGLHVYGAKVTQGDQLVKLIAKFTP